jgi:hypothetical protein
MMPWNAGQAIAWYESRPAHPSFGPAQLGFPSIVGGGWICEIDGVGTSTNTTTTGFDIYIWAVCCTP